MNYGDRNTFVNMKFLYSAIPDPDFYVYVLIDDLHADLEGKFRDTMIFMRGARGRQFYPQSSTQSSTCFAMHVFSRNENMKYSTMI